MAKSLLIVESPSKAKKIAPMLGDGWMVAASVGHIRDLPVRGETGKETGFVPNAPGVRVETYELVYEISPEKKDIVKKLREKISFAGAIYLATDPDREGEAIAWHLAQVLKLRSAKRVTFHEITKPAILHAIANPRAIDQNLVQAQEARRALDRLFGYRVSSSLRRVTQQKLTAGRVQTVAVLLIVDREREIANFVPQTHFGVILHFSDDGKAWTAEWNCTNFLPAKHEEKLWLDEAVATQIAEVRHVQVKKCQNTIARKAPPAPFTTATLQQAAANALFLDVERTMSLAQSLFTKGFITYHRTDSPNLSNEAIDTIRRWATEQQLPLPEKPRRFAAKTQAQEAHEAIRPTRIALADATTASDTPATTAEQALYGLIRSRAIASQLADAVYDVRTALLESRDAVHQGKHAQFVARGSTLTTPGFKAFLADDQAEEKEDPIPKNPVPNLPHGAAKVALDGTVEKRTTKAPPRYKEYSLVKALEHHGIGRPSTYASIISLIVKREYVIKGKEKNFHPTPLGEALVDTCRGRFSFVDIAYTRNMEHGLDLIAQGKYVYIDLLKSANAELDQELLAFQKSAPKSISASGKTIDGPLCSVCSQGTLLLKSRVPKGKRKVQPYWLCNQYPHCRAAFDDVKGKPAATPWAARTTLDDPNAIRCPSCTTSALMRRAGRRPGEFWWGCTGYPKCSATFPDHAGQPNFEAAAAKAAAHEDAHPCKHCSAGKMLLRNGKTGQFFGCSCYPKCKATEELLAPVTTSARTGAIPKR